MHVRQRVIAPVGQVLLAHEHERDVVAVACLLARVMDDHADAPGQLEVIDEERDPHEPGGDSSSPAPDSGRPSSRSKSWM